MSGHNKWSKVKNIKGVADAKKSKIWTKIIREITVSAKLGGVDPAGNPRLRKALEDARTNNLAKEPVQRALAKAAGKDDATDYEELTYEGYGPAGVAILVACLSDNRNRTYAEVRAAFNKNGGNIGAPGSVAYAFQKIELEMVPNHPIHLPQKQSELLEKLVDALEDLDDVQKVWTSEA